jgi:ABC-type antimicrobial peptide transport system permease subunit
VVSRDYYDLLGIALLQGRGFNADDRSTAPRVCVVNETFAARLFPGEPVVGRALLMGNNARVEIVGVIKDVKSAGINVPVPEELYVPLSQVPRPGLNVLARTGADPGSLQKSIANAVKAVDPTQAVSFFATLESNITLSFGTQQLAATLTGGFSVLALALSLTGLYSVLAHLVAQRTPEIGIRMALGASRLDVIRLVMRSGALLVGVGVVLGLAGAGAAGRVIEQQLFEVQPLSPVIYAGVAVIFAAVALTACLVPSLRASRIDPLVACRIE